MPWLARIALTLGVVAFGLAAPALPGDALPGFAAPCAGAAEQTIRVSVVVDDGAGGPPRIDCVTVPAKVRAGQLQATGAAVLAARASQLGLTAPRWGSTGLMCAIDGYPASGCAEPGAAGYVYWSYWQGDGNRWVYSSHGPAFRYVKDGAVEGWRYGNGGGTGQDLAPRSTPSAARCPDPAPKPVPPTAPPAAPPTGSGTGSGPTGSTGGTTGSGSAAGPPAARPGTGPTAGAPTTVPAMAPTTTPTTAAGDPPADPSTTTTIDVDVEGTTEERTAPESVEIPGDTGGGGGWTGTAVGLGTLGAAAIGLTVLGRRRRSAN